MNNVGIKKMPKKELAYIRSFKKASDYIDDIYRHNWKRDGFSATEDNIFVYLFFNPITKLYKIGISDDPVRRASDIGRSCGCDILIMLATQPCADIEPCPRLIEISLHRFFINKRVKGEWFLLDKPDIVNIMRWLMDEIEYERIIRNELVN